MVLGLVCMETAFKDCLNCLSARLQYGDPLLQDRGMHKPHVSNTHMAMRGEREVGANVPL